MSNNTNLFTNSQTLNIDSEQKRIINTLYRCSEPEILLIRFAKTKERGIGSRDVMHYLLYSDSASSSILSRLANSKNNTRLIFPPLVREKCGPRGTWLYFVREEVKLQDIDQVIQEQKYSYERFIDGQKKKKSTGDSGIYQDQISETSTYEPVGSTEINHQEAKNLQQERTESTVSDFDNVKNQETKLPNLAEFNEDEFPFMFDILKKELVEKDKQLQQLQKEYEKVITTLIKQKAG
ncbi:MAG: hypothetical protein V7L05_32895 [Nostoc sp.]|uniref:hypothetical protein n=1 Tax=Nostoc sp. TaxID=1180 RepID=UPI002FF69EE2